MKNTKITTTTQASLVHRQEDLLRIARPALLALGATFALSLMASNAVAQVPPEPIRVGLPSYNGTGCPSGSVSASVSPDNSELSILFGSFQVDAGGNSGKTVDRKACNVSIPVQVPQGFSVSMFRIDYRGYHRVPHGASGTFDVEYFFAGSTGPAYRKTFIGYSDGNFLLNNRVTAVSTVWSACGASVNLRTNTSIAIQTNSIHEQATMTLDSADVAAGVVYQLQWKRCDGYADDPIHSPQPLPPAPQPLPPAPQPLPQPAPIPHPGLGVCEISVRTDYRGLQTFMVRDGYGSIIAHTSQYAEALRQAREAEYRGSCRGIRDLVRQSPGHSTSSCRIIQSVNRRGLPVFQVVDRYQRVLLQTRLMSEARRAMEFDSRCSS